MADSAPEYAVDALDRVLQARGARPLRGTTQGGAPASTASTAGTAGASLVEGPATEPGEEAFTLPTLDFSFNAPSFLGNRSRWVLFVLLVMVATLALVLAWDMVRTTSGDAGSEWVLPPIFTLVVAVFALAFAFAAVMGFGQVGLNSSIGDAPAGSAPAGSAPGPGRVAPDSREPAGPKVSGAVPPDKATGIATDVQIEATFSEAIDPASLTAASFVLRRHGDRTPVAASVRMDADRTTGRLTPSAPLAASASYDVEITTAIQARSGPALAAARKWSFTTAA